MFTYTCEMVKANNFAVNFSSDDLYASNLVDPILSIKTYYEQQWLARGLTIKYIQFVIDQNNDLTEPISKLNMMLTEASAEVKDTTWKAN